MLQSFPFAYFPPLSFVRSEETNERNQKTMPTGMARALRRDFFGCHAGGGGRVAGYPTLQHAAGADRGFSVFHGSAGTSACREQRSNSLLGVGLAACNLEGKRRSGRTARDEATFAGSACNRRLAGHLPPRKTRGAAKLMPADMLVRNGGDTALRSGISG
jgi:hypothetical protein